MSARQRLRSFWKSLVWAVELTGLMLEGIAVMFGVVLSVAVALLLLLLFLGTLLGAFLKS